jgi:preprotein translocase subunit SecE
MGRGGDEPMAEGRKIFLNSESEMAKDSGKTSPGEFVRQVRSEASKVVWPTREETVRMAILVAILTLILSLFFLGVDTLFGAMVRWLLSLV